MSSFVHHRNRLSTAANVSVFHHATVVEIQSDGEPATIRRLVVANATDRRFRVTARQYVLAAGGIENARLLLASRGHHPSGLGNGEDVVGRFFMEHPTGRIGFLRPPNAAIVGEMGLYDSHREGPVFVQGALNLSAQVIRREGLRNAAFFLLPRSDSFVSESVRSLRALMVGSYRRPWEGHAIGHLRNLVTGVRPLTQTLLGKIRLTQLRAELLVVRTQSEQAPDPASRVTLGSARDRYGIPRPVLDWRLSQADLASIRRSEDLLDDELERIGLDRIQHKYGEEDPPVVFEGNYHHMGTTRMHVDPRQGVVDPDGRVHGVSNLHITGTSVFPTGGYINPTYTVVALAIRLADRLRTVLGVERAA
jgi:choline dehydrogenase-like flavoprotein